MEDRTAPPCPCGLGASHATCCGRWTPDQPAPTAEALMRSRYSAYVRRDEALLLATWHTSTRPAQLDLADLGPPPKWLGLQVLRAETTGADTAVVEFVARYSLNGRAHRLHETSRFCREASAWFYLDGEVD